MLETEDLDIIVEKIESRKRILERVEGMEQQACDTTTHDRIRLLLARVVKIEEELREYGLMIDTMGVSNG